MKPPERSPAPSSQPPYADDEVPRVVSAGILPGRRRRKPTRTELFVLLPLLVVAAGAVLAVPVFALSYAVAGTAPLLAGTGSADGPVSVRSRIEAAVLGGLFIVLVAVVARAVFVRRFAAPFVVVDEEGVWLGRGRNRQQGLAWAEIAAMEVVPADAARIPDQQGGARPRRGKAAPVVRAGLARKPFMDLYPVEKVSEGPGTPLGSRVVTAQPSAPGLRGRRYVVELAGPAEDIDALARALVHHAPGKRLTSS